LQTELMLILSIYNSTLNAMHFQFFLCGEEKLNGVENAVRVETLCLS
jgi:hypothetical protein